MSERLDVILAKSDLIAAANKVMQCGCAPTCE